MHGSLESALLKEERSRPYKKQSRVLLSAACCVAFFILFAPEWLVHGGLYSEY
jgi:hypothetical protein